MTDPKGKRGENVVVQRQKTEIGRFPLHNLQMIVSFSYAGASPALMGACAERDVGLSFCTPRGKFLARTSGISRGNVLLRRKQYRMADDLEASCKIASSSIFGKVYNSRWVVERMRRDHGMRINGEEFTNVSRCIKENLPVILGCTSLDALRGLEGAVATAYFGIFDQMILRNKEIFAFEGRSRRPPTDRVNAMLSFGYSLLANNCASALESVGLDAYVGFLHRDRPGRTSLALDLMEEFRPCMVDRFVLTLINNGVIGSEDFDESETGAVLLNEDGRRKFLRQWRNRMQETITHPYLEEKIPWGLVPFIQALLLARYIRGDLDRYPAFLWE